MPRGRRRMVRVDNCNIMINTRDSHVTQIVLILFQLIFVKNIFIIFFYRCVDSIGESVPL